MVLLSSHFVFAACFQQVCNACTTFQINHNGHFFVGKNTDWMVEDGFIFINKRNVTKTAVAINLFDKPDPGQPVSWTSKYGSLTFNQFGREFPFGGINEKGLIVEMLVHSKAKFPKPDSRASISVFQWVQYQLDNFASIEEVLANGLQLRIRPRHRGGDHFLIHDKKGNVAVIEFINGEEIYYINDSLPFKVLTNSTYSEALGYLRQDKIPSQDNGKSIERFIKAVTMLKKYNPANSKSGLDYAFDIMKEVSWSSSIGDGMTMNSIWSIVYDVNNLRIYFRTLENQKIRTVDLNSFDFSCSKPVKVLDLNTQISGNVTNKFTDYTQQTNQVLVKNAFRKIPSFVIVRKNLKAIIGFIESGFQRLPGIPEADLEAFIKYPETTFCKKSIY